MTDAAAKADAAMAAGEKKLAPGLMNMFKSSTKYEEAAEHFELAANNYKLAKLWAECAKAYERLAECHIKLDNKYDTANALVDAAKAAARVDPARSNEILQKAVSMYTDMGRLNQAARQLRDIAENYDKQGLKQDAVNFYMKAADLFEAEKQGSSEATKCNLKVAEFSAELGKYREAVQIFEDAAKLAVENNLLKFSARGYLLNAGICLLCYANEDELTRKLDTYRDIDLQFERSREETLLEALVDAFRNEDEQAFATSLAEYDQVTRLDAWKTKILLAGKHRIAEITLGVGSKGGGGGGGGGGRGRGSKKATYQDTDDEDDDDDVL